MGTHARKIAVAGISIMLTLVMAPVQAFAATGVMVGGDSYDNTQYPAGASGSGWNGGKWAWDGANEMALDGYDGGPIGAVGDLDVTLSGDNSVDAGGGMCGIAVQDGDLSITGDGTLDITADAIASTDGIFVRNGDVDIEGTEVSVDVDGGIRVTGIRTVNGNVTIDDSTVDLDVASSGGTSAGIVATGGGVSLSNADVAINNSASTDGYGILSYRNYVNVDDSDLTIENTAKEDGYGIAAFGGNVNMDGSTVAISSTTTGNASWESLGITADTTASGEGGDVSIRKSEVTVKTSGTARDSSGAIDATNGDISITDGSRVVATDSSSVSDESTGIAAHRETGAKGGSITIGDSDVTASGNHAGIIAADRSGLGSPVIAIGNSDVSASGDICGIAAFEVNADHPGALTITDSSIVSPEGGHVLDVADSASSYYGQTVGTGDGPITQVFDSSSVVNPRISSDVVITKVQKPMPVPETIASETTAQETPDALPKTGDDSLVPLAMVSLLAIGGTLLLTHRKIVRSR